MARSRSARLAPGSSSNSQPHQALAAGLARGVAGFAASPAGHAGGAGACGERKALQAPAAGTVALIRHVAHTARHNRALQQGQHSSQHGCTHSTSGVCMCLLPTPRHQTADEHTHRLACAGVWQPARHALRQARRGLRACSSRCSTTPPRAHSSCRPHALARSPTHIVAHAFAGIPSAVGHSTLQRSSTGRAELFIHSTACRQGARARQLGPTAGSALVWRGSPARTRALPRRASSLGRTRRKCSRLSCSAGNNPRWGGTAQQERVGPAGRVDKGRNQEQPSYAAQSLRAPPLTAQPSPDPPLTVHVLPALEQAQGAMQTQAAWLWSPQTALFAQAAGVVKSTASLLGLHPTLLRANACSRYTWPAWRGLVASNAISTCARQQPSCVRMHSRQAAASSAAARRGRTAGAPGRAAWCRAQSPSARRHRPRAWPSQCIG